MNYIIKSLLPFILLTCTPPSYSVEVPLSDIPTGKVHTIIWKELPVYIYKRTDKEIEYLLKKGQQSGARKLDSHLTNLARIAGNEYASLFLHSQDIDTTPLRSYNKDYLVVLATVPFRGCIISPARDKGITYFRSSCPNEFIYDLSGRSKKYYNLLIPPHSFEKDKIIFRDSGEIIDFSPDIESLSMSEGERLIEAILWNKLDMAKSIIKRSPSSAIYANEQGATALTFSARTADFELIDMLINNEAQLNRLDKQGYGAVHFAIISGKKETAAYLIKNGAKIKNHCENGVCVPDIRKFIENFNPTMSQLEIDSYINGILKTDLK